MKKTREKLWSRMPIIIFIIGLFLLLYPTFSDHWNSVHQSRAIAGYSDAVASINQYDYDKMLREAHEYNQKIFEKGQDWKLSEAEYEEYNSLLNFSGNGIMGYIEIPSINVMLTIYHGVDPSVLQIAAGHIEGSSLPIGGENTHAVISGHRGLPSAKLFTDLDRLKEGDLFMIRILNETFTYEVDQIRIIMPHEVQDLNIIEGEELCTLVTCTPYGINTHRILVRGHRVENLEDAVDIRVTADAMQIDPVIVAPALAMPVLLVLVLWVLIYYRKPNK